MIVYASHKLLYNITVRTFYSKVTIRGEEHLSPGKPVIIAMNHPNAFMDPVSFATVVKPTMNFLARGDAFTKGLKPILESVGIIPIYRMIDSGREGVQKNDETFRTVTQRLKVKQHVIIFAEGFCIQERRLRPLKKGCVRMAFGAMEELNEDVLIVPVGMNYQNNPSKFRHKLFIEIGEPLQVKDYFGAYRENNAKAVNLLTARLQERMKETLVHIADPGNDELVEGIEEIYQEQALEEKGIHRHNLEKRHEFTLKLTAAINRLTAEDPERIHTLRNEVKLYLEELRKRKLRDKLFREKYRHYTSAGSLLARSLLFLAGIPVWAFGLLTNYIPYLTSIAITRRVTKGIEWYAAVSVLIGSWLFPLYYLAQCLAVWFIFKDWRILFAFTALAFFSGWFSLHFSPFRKKLFGSFRMRALKKDSLAYKRLAAQREAIIADIQSLPA